MSIAQPALDDDWVDVGQVLKQETAKWDPGHFIMSKGFTLTDAMSAIQVNNQ